VQTQRPRPFQPAVLTQPLPRIYLKSYWRMPWNREGHRGENLGRGSIGRRRKICGESDQAARGAPYTGASALGEYVSSAVSEAECIRMPKIIPVRSQVESAP
jgi:hypothetical protein